MYIQVVTTVDKKEDGEKIARALLEKNLAGCIQLVGPVESMYWWQGAIETAEEYQCIIKSKQTLFEAIEKVIRTNHPYGVPEIIATPLTAGGKDYLAWLEGELDNSQ